MARTANKGSAELRTWDLNSDSTRYDYLLAAPSDEALTRYWTAWAVISTFGGFFVAVILMGVVSSRKTRSLSFNLYLIYLMIPDAVYSILCGLVCMVHAINKHQVAGMCNFQMMFIVWGVGSNMWLNAAVSHQLYTMLQDSDMRRKYKVPPPSFVTRQAIAIYLFMIFLGSWGLIESPKFPHYVASTSGLACLPVEHDWKSSIFFWVVFFPLFGGIPILYIKYVTYNIWKKGLLPPAGRRRLLVVYFGRIVVVFVLMWVPYMVLLFMFATWMPTWVHFWGGTLSHLQGAISATLCMLKPDIYYAVKGFLTCKVGRERDDLEAEPQESRKSRWFVPSNRSLQACSSPSSYPFPSHRSRQESSADVESNASATHLEESADLAADQASEGLWPDMNGEYSSDLRHANQTGTSDEVDKEEDGTLPFRATLEGLDEEEKEED